MGNVLKREKQEQIKALGRLGWSLRRIEQETNVCRATIRRYLVREGILMRPPRGRRLAADPNVASQVTPDFEAAEAPRGRLGPERPLHSNVARQVTPDLERPRAADSKHPVSRCEPFREQIAEALDRGRNGKAIWQELVDVHGFSGSYESMKRFVRKLRGALPKQAHPTIVTEPGIEAQVDYGTGPMVRYPKTGKYRRTRLFALTLGCSRKAVWLLCFKSSSERWCELHREAFERLGGTTKTVVLDNLKEGVLKPDVFDPELNPLYRDFLAHYGVTALPARVRHPDRKGKVERSVGYAQDTGLKGKRFETLEEAQAELDRWSKRWADTRIHGTTKRQVAAMFEAERPFLQPLPSEPFRFYKYGVRTVHLDGCVEVAAAYYAALPGWIGKQLRVTWDGTWVRLVDPNTGVLLREHRRQGRGGRSMPVADRPARTPATTLELLERAQRAGVCIGEVCRLIHRQKGEAGVRQILGVLSMAKKNGAEAVDEACRTALEVGSPTYRFVQRWISKKAPVPLTLRQVDPLIRELTEYRDIIERMTTTENE